MFPSLFLWYINFENKPWLGAPSIYIYLVRDIKPRILFSPKLSPKLSQLEQLKKKTNYLLVQNRFFLSFGQTKSLFSVSSGWTEKISRKKMGKIKFVVWQFDVTNKIILYWRTMVSKIENTVVSCCCQFLIPILICLCNAYPLQNYFAVPVPPHSWMMVSRRDVVIYCQSKTVFSSNKDNS